MKYVYELKMKVRDYECDLQGIVNNANYQHYTEHTRHEFLLQSGISCVPDETMVLRSQIDIVCLVNGQLGECPELEALLEPYFEKA